MYLDDRAGVSEASSTDDDPYEKPPTITQISGPPGIERYKFTVMPNATEHRLFQAKVFYLTSTKTASAAEIMAEALKRTHRGVIIGERTYGAGNAGFFVPIGQGLEAFLTWGRTLDPVTGDDWEGAGSRPMSPFPRTRRSMKRCTGPPRRAATHDRVGSQSGAPPPRDA